ncbi:g11632 [Coccomyxa elongata]
MSAAQRREWDDDHQQLFPRLAQHSFSQQAGLMTEAKKEEQMPSEHAQQPGTSSQSRKTVVQAFQNAGWTREAVYNVPNAISLARLISGPFVAYLILHEYWATALGTLAVAGASDWADGYAAKHYGQSSVLGSYLDPFADKVLVCCTVGALAQQGSLPVALASIIIGRDVLLVTGAFVDRARKVGWKRVDWAEFFRLSPSQLSSEADAAQAGAENSRSAQEMALSTLLSPNDSDFFSALSPFGGLGGLLSDLPRDIDRNLRPIPINTDKNFEVTADIPGVDRGDINVTVDGEVLRIGVTQEEVREEPGVRYHRRVTRRVFHAGLICLIVAHRASKVERVRRFVERRIRLPDSADTSRITASYDNGVLTVIVPKREGAATQQRIDVGGATTGTAAT